MAALVGVASLIASGNDRAGRNATCAQNCGINFCPQQFGSERLSLPAQSLSRARFRRFQHLNRAFESSFCDSQGASHHFNFFVGFGFTLRPEKSVRRANANFVCREFLCVTKRKTKLAFARRTDFSGRSVDRKSTRLNSSHTVISYAVFCLKK